MILFTYKKPNKLLFFNVIEAKRIHENMIKSGWQHISTIYAATYMNQIAATIMDDAIPDSIKVQRIRDLLESE
jgi:hypothetical protein